MGALYDKMLRDMKLKNLADGTQAEYLRPCKALAAFFMKSPAELSEDEVKEYLGHLQATGASVETLKMQVAALCFLYGVTLGRQEPWQTGCPARKCRTRSPTSSAAAR